MMTFDEQTLRKTLLSVLGADARYAHLGENEAGQAFLGRLAAAVAAELVRDHAVLLEEAFGGKANAERRLQATIAALVTREQARLRFEAFAQQDGSARQPVAAVLAQPAMAVADGAGASADDAAGEIPQALIAASAGGTA